MHRFRVSLGTSCRRKLELLEDHPELEEDLGEQEEPLVADDSEIDLDQISLQREGEEGEEEIDLEPALAKFARSSTPVIPALASPEPFPSATEDDTIYVAKRFLARYLSPEDSDAIQQAVDLRKTAMRQQQQQPASRWPKRAMVKRCGQNAADKFFMGREPEEAQWPSALSALPHPHQASYRLRNPVSASPAPVSPTCLAKAQSPNHTLDSLWSCQSESVHKELIPASSALARWGTSPSPAFDLMDIIGEEKVERNKMVIDPRRQFTGPPHQNVGNTGDTSNAGTGGGIPEFPARLAHQKGPLRAPCSRSPIECCRVPGFFDVEERRYDG